ncbi:MAG: hypothetical protein ACOCXZ_02300 [Chloroflexota bacterium]
MALKIDDLSWLDRHAEPLYDRLRSMQQDPEQRPALVDALLLILPKVVLREDFRKWSMLVHSVYETSSFANSNGFDGVGTKHLSPIFIYQKRPPVEQPPIKTRRNKRYIPHPTRTAEMYQLLFTAHFLQPTVELSPARVEAMMRLMRSVSDPYLTGKMHLLLAFIYNMRGESELAWAHAHTAYGYWSQQPGATTDTLTDSGLAAYALAVAHAGSGIVPDALSWYGDALRCLAQTPHQPQSYLIALEAAYCALNGDKPEAAAPFIEVALDLADSPAQQAAAHNIRALALAASGRAALAHQPAEEALALWTELNNAAQILYVGCTGAYIEARLGGLVQAVQRLDDVLSQAGAMPPEFVTAVERMRAAYAAGSIIPPPLP